MGCYRYVRETLTLLTSVTDRTRYSRFVRIARLDLAPCAAHLGNDLLLLLCRKPLGNRLYRWNTRGITEHGNSHLTGQFSVLRYIYQWDGNVQGRAQIDRMLLFLHDDGT